MGKWENFKEFTLPDPTHFHDLPWADDGFHPGKKDKIPDAGTIWRCSCGRTWQVYKGKQRSAVILMSWTVYGEYYCLLPINADQPDPFPERFSC